jgi:hypothetical protein
VDRTYDPVSKELRLLSRTYASEGTKTPHGRRAKTVGYWRIVKLSVSSEPLFKDETRFAEERHNRNTEAY